jgi:hypothetical protein
MEGTLAGADTGILGLCCPEHSSVVEVWILSKEKSIGDDGAGQGGYHKGNKVFFGDKGADELKIGPNGIIGFRLPSAIVHRNLNCQIFLNWAFEQQPVYP